MTDKKLYKIEYKDSEGFLSVDWVWLEEGELEEYLDSMWDHSAICREGSREEEELYNEAYAEGVGSAMIEEIIKNHNGVTFELGDLENYNESGILKTTKIFECGVCGTHSDYYQNTAATGEFYLSVEKNDVLWYVCFDCAIKELGV